MLFLKARMRHISHITHGWWAAIYGAWTVVCSLDVLIEHYASASVKVAYDQAWVAPKWGWDVSIIGFLAITVGLVLEGSYRFVARIELASSEALSKSEKARRDAESRRYDGRPILVLQVAAVAPTYLMGPPQHVFYLKNCGNRPARWVNIPAVQSTGRNFRLSFARTPIIEPQAAETLAFEVSKIDTSAGAALESFLADTPDGIYVTWYDMKIEFRDTDESMRSETARLAYWPGERHLASVEVPYTRRTEVSSGDTGSYSMP
jgi:hypothetical protein